MLLYLYSYIPIVVAKCGLFLKQKGKLGGLQYLRVTDTDFIWSVCSNYRRRSFQDIRLHA
jgi:hypothetical protein